MPDKAEVASRIAHAILKDATDRRGWRQEWDRFDADIKDEIVETWAALALKVLEADGD